MTVQTAPRPAPSRASGLRLFTLAALAAALILPVSGIPALSQADPVVAKVDGVEVRQSDLDLAEEDLGQNAQQMSGEQKREYLVGYVADILLSAKAAEGKRVMDQKEFKQRLAFIRSKLLMELMLQAEGKAAATDQAMRKVYEEAITQMSGEMEVRARHILVPTEAEAKSVVAELNKGTDFAELAKLRSKDPGAAAEGGDLGYFGKDQMVPEFAEAAFKLEKGQLSEPVKSQFGWHVIKVEDKRKKPAPEFDKVKEQLETFVTRRAQADLVAKLREAAKIERLDK